ncbi:N-acetyltransferase [Brevundimonas sp.]|uniref:N-acetyltransferase n=1 Tax=Brevundimonas sp. TaxID=1871086 RepID=UPI00289B3A41|nr:N-acetyltransferase [Brevundimonas sp.]
MAVRPFELADIEGVNALHTQINWPAPSAEQWQWLASNPARGTSPMGWVIDNHGRIDGFLGNFRQTYYRDSAVLSAATGHSIIVSPRVKGALRELIQPFLSQKDLFAVSILNANEIGSPIYRHYGLKPFSAPVHDIKLAWLLAPHRIVVAKILRSLAARLPSLYPMLGERFLPRPVPAFDARSVAWPAGVHAIADLSDNSAFARFWQQLMGDGELVAERCPALLRWRLAMPDLTSRPVLLGYYDEQGLCAYAMGQLSKVGPIEVVTLEIIDLIALKRAPATAIPTLIRALKLAARKLQAAKLRLPLVSARTQAALGSTVGLAHNEGGWGHAFAHFSAPEAGFADWQPTPFEGSYSFTLRQPYQ